MDIPPIFYNTVKDLPFSNCSKCDRFLLDGSMEYLVEKICIPNDVLYEFAICQYCIEQLHQEISKESMQNMQAFQNKQMNKGFQIIDDYLNLNIERIKKVLTNKQPNISYESCNIIAYFKGNAISPTMPAVCVSTQILENMQDKISKKTRDNFDDFTDFLGGVPPDLEDLFKVRPRVLI